MPGSDKTISETLIDAIESQKTNSSTAVKETNDTLSSGQSSETEAGETLEEYQGISLSDIPAEDRPKFVKKLEEKFKLADKGIQKKFQEVAPLRKALDQLESLGYTPETAMEVLSNAKRSQTPQQVVSEQKKALRKLDEMIQNSPMEQRTQLENFREIILEETGIKDLRSKLEQIESALGMISNVTLTTRRKEINIELDGLASKYGEDFINKYRDKVVDVALKYPNVSLTKIIRNETEDDEYEQAILSRGKKTLTQEKKNAISSKSSGVSSMDKVDTKSMSLKDLLSESFKKGR